MIQALAPLILPLIEAFGPAIGSAAAATGTAAAGGAAAATATTGAAATMGGASTAGGAATGLSGILGRLAGMAPALGSTEELGTAVQSSTELANAIAGLKQSISASHDRQAEMVAGAKHTDEFTGAKIDNSQSPDHLKALAELQAQRTAMEKEARAKNAQLTDTHARIAQTTNPRSPIETISRLGGLAGAAAAFGPMLGGGSGSDRADPNLASQIVNAPSKALLGPFAGLANMLPMVAAGKNAQQAMLQPFTDLGVGKAEGKVIGSATEFASEGIAKALNPFSLMTGQFHAHMAKLPGLVRDWGEELVESQRHLAAYNSTLAHAYAEAERRGVMRNVESAQRTSGATAGLSDALQDLADTVQPMKDAVTIVISRGVEELVRGVTLGVEMLKELCKLYSKFKPGLESLRKLIEKAGQGNPHPTELTDFLREVNNNDYTRPRRVPRR